MACTRRKLLELPLKLPVALGLGTAVLYSREAEAEGSNATLRFVVPADYVPSLGVPDQERITRAAMRFIEATFPGTLPIWNRGLAAIDLEKRIRLGVHHLCEEIAARHAALDPVWLVSMVLAESFFNEFAVSPSLAVGVSQFILPTAKGYQLRCGEQPGTLFSQYATEEQRYWELHAQRRALPEQQHFTLEQALSSIVSNPSKKEQVHAKEQLDNYQQREKLLQDTEDASSHFRQYLEANVVGKNIFKSEDRHALQQLDERLTPHTALPAMVRLMNDLLKQRKGNILVATAGYNAGPQSTGDEGPYAAYGRIPANRETTLYVSRILVNYTEIKARI